MKKQLTSLVVVIALLVCAIGVTPKVASAKNGLATPKLTKCKKIPSLADGVSYKTTWKKIKGADGYQVCNYEQEVEGDSWYSYKYKTKKCYTTIGFSSLHAFKIKVRAYKIVNGKKVYGAWSKAVKKVMHW